MKDIKTGETVGKQVILKISNKTYYCSCGCNVFTEYEKNKYRCNSCNDEFFCEE